MAARVRRLFFALWPDDPLRHRLLHWQTANLRGDVRWQHRADLHMTLHFVGEVTRDRTAGLVDLGSRLASPLFELTLDRVGFWPGPGVLWAGPSQTPGALLGLHRMLADGLQSLGFATETRPYRPHVTLARKVREPVAVDIEPLAWSVRRWALVESCPGPAPRYRPLAQWRLVGDDSVDDTGKPKENELDLRQ